jgi:hypothetical protein
VVDAVTCVPALLGKLLTAQVILPAWEDKVYIFAEGYRRIGINFVTHHSCM